MRRLIRPLVLLAIVAACASTGQLPGGPERHTPPVLLKVTPDSGATNVRLDHATFQFDEVLSQKPAKGEYDQVFIVSPRDGDPNVDWHRARITVSPRHGFKPNTAYTITMTSGLSDLRGNVTKEGRQIVFSTGPTLPKFGIVGHAFDWESEKPAIGATIEAIRRPDSTVFVTLTDSTGAFDIGPFGPGTYTVRGYLDQNANFQIDRLEKWDSLKVSVADTRPVVELLLIARDSIAPAMSSVTAVDTLAVRVSFDRALLAGPAGLGTFTITRADSTRLTIDSVLTATAFDSLRRASAARALADSLKRVDTTKKADTTRKVDTTKAAVPLLPPVDTTGTRRLLEQLPKPSVPAPPTGVVLLLSPKSPLVPGATYRVTSDVEGMGHSRATTTRQLTMPKAKPAPKDTTRKAPADTLTRPPAAPVRRPPR